MFKKQILLPLIIGGLVGSFFMQTANGVYQEGAYAYFQYARNIARGNGLSFNPGEITFGVTNIIWTLILAGCAKAFNIIKASQIIGILLFSLSGAIWTMISFNITKKEWVSLMIGVLYVLNPTAIWFSVNGMDTMLCIFTFSVIMLHWQKHKFNRPLILGVLNGLAFLNRADFIILVPIFLIYLTIKEKKHSLKPTLLFLLAFIIIIFPWITVIYAHTGQIVPSTKMGALFCGLPRVYNLTFSQFNSLGLWKRLAICGKVVYQLFVGAESRGVRFILFPLSLITFLSIPTLVIIKRDYLFTHPLLLLLWIYLILLFVGYGLTFPFPKPRYFAPIVPIAITVSMIIISDLIIKKEKLFILLCSFLIVLHIPVLLHSNKSYKSIVEMQNIEVEVGKWLKENTPLDSKIALSPSARMGFYSERYIIDMSGTIDQTIWQYQCIKEGYTSPEPIYQCLKCLKPDYIFDETCKPTISKAVAMYPSNFTLVKNIGNAQKSYSIYKCNF